MEKNLTINGIYPKYIYIYRKYIYIYIYISIYTGKKNEKRRLSNNLCSRSRTRRINTLQKNTFKKKYDMYFPYNSSDNFVTLRANTIFAVNVLVTFSYH
jgi:hypothetical protein